MHKRFHVRYNKVCYIQESCRQMPYLEVSLQSSACWDWSSVASAAMDGVSWGWCLHRCYIHTITLLHSYIFLSNMTNIHQKWLLHVRTCTCSETCRLVCTSIKYSNSCTCTYDLFEQALATSVSVQKEFLLAVPDSWSLEQAATVPVVYSTAYYALVVRGRIQAGDKVLIHSGSGGVGQAAIAVALHCGCDVYTTVSSQEVSTTSIEHFYLFIYKRRSCR